MKHMIKILIISTILFSATACVKEEKKDLFFRITWTDYSGRGVAIQKVLDIYNENNDNYHIVLQSGH